MDYLQDMKDSLEKDLIDLEVQIADNELQYLQSEYSQYGTVLKGFEGFLASKNAERGRRGRTLKPEDRLMSLSSATGPVAREVEQMLELDGPLGGATYGKKGYGQKGYGQKGYNQKGKR